MREIGHLLLKDLTPEQEKVLASDIRSDILSNAALYGGHLSSNLGVVELTIALLRHFDPYRDDILFDVGHQTYAYKILTGRTLKGLRQFGGESPFSEPDESKADKYRNGHASTALPVAYGMALAKKEQGLGGYTVAVVGDASLSSGLSMEALGLLSNDRKTNLILVLNDNGMSIGKDVSFIGRNFQKIRNSRLYFRTSNFLGKHMANHRLSWRVFLKLRDLKDTIRRITIAPSVFEAMGIKYIGPFDGNDFESLDLAFNKAKAVCKEGPVVVHLLTKKGYGYPPAMNDEEGRFHGVPKAFDEGPVPATDSFTAIKSAYLLERMETDRKAFVLTPAMVYGSNLEAIFKKYPTRTLDVGIAEENAVTMASGLALKGLHPVVDIYSTFLQRAYDEVLEDIAREKVSALFLVERAGLVGSDGASHQGLYDVAFLQTIPGTRIFLPYDERSLRRILDRNWFKEKIGTFVRIPKDEPARDVVTVQEGILADFLSKRSGNRTLVLTTGPNGARLFRVLGEKKDYDFALLTDLNPSRDSLSLLLSGYDRVFFYDSYSTLEGTAKTIGDVLAGIGRAVTYRAFAFDNVFVPHGSLKDLYSAYDLSPEQVAKRLDALL